MAGNDPILNCPQVSRTEILSGDAVAVEFTGWRRQRGQLRLHLCGQFHVMQAFEDLLSGEIVGDFIVKGQHEV